jgi:hypothetical protein
MRTQSVTQRFEFIRYSLGSITFLVCYFRAVRYVFLLPLGRIEKKHTLKSFFRAVICFFPPKYVFSMDTNRLVSIIFFTDHLCAEEKATTRSTGTRTSTAHRSRYR